MDFLYNTTLQCILILIGYQTTHTENANGFKSFAYCENPIVQKAGQILRARLHATVVRANSTRIEQILDLEVDYDIQSNEVIGWAHYSTGMPNTTRIDGKFFDHNKGTMYNITTGNSENYAGVWTINVDHKLLNMEAIISSNYATEVLNRGINSYSSRAKHLFSDIPFNVMETKDAIIASYKYGKDLSKQTSDKYLLKVFYHKNRHLSHDILYINDKPFSSRKYEKYKIVGDIELPHQVTTFVNEGDGTYSITSVTFHKIEIISNLSGPISFPIGSTLLDDAVEAARTVGFRDFSKFKLLLDRYRLIGKK